MNDQLLRGFAGLPGACFRRPALLAALLLGGGQAGAGNGPPPQLQVPELLEVSGLAASLRSPGWFWVHNDSGNPPRLYAIDVQGRLRQTVNLRAENRDWEDIAAFAWHGEPWLAVADTGDNLHWYRQSRILLLTEPLPVPEPSSIGVARRIVFDYPDGRPDVEAMAVDAQAGQILLLEKIRPPARLYALDLEGPEQQQAQLLGEMPDWWPEPPTPVETIGDSRYRGAATAMDLSRDDLHLAVLTGTHWMVFSRSPGESWSQALQRRPCSGRIRQPGQPRWRTIFEALAWDAQDRLWISGEAPEPPLLSVYPAPLCAAGGAASASPPSGD